MFNKTLNLLLAGIITIFGFQNLSAAASPPTVRFSAKPLWLSICKTYNVKPPARTIKNGYYFALSERQINIEQRQDYHHVIKEIISDAGIQNGSEISIKFDPSYELLSFHELVVWRNNRPINRLELSAFKIIANEEDLSKFIYNGSYSAYQILKDIRKGDRIEYSYTLTGQNPIFGNHFSKELYLQSNQPFAHLYTVLFASPARKLNIKTFNGLAQPTVSTAGSLKKYSWENFQVPAVQDYDNTPSWFNNYSYAQVTDFDTWKQVADWSLSINQPSINIGGELGSKIAELKKKTKNDKASYFREAVKIVQNEVRYMGVELGEYSHKANMPEKVFAQRYGDCKDKSLLLVSMLKANGIEANMALLNTELGDKLSDMLPSAVDFDHAVVVANVNGKQVWVDATMSYQGGTGTNIYFPNYGKALILKPGTIGLTSIPRTKIGREIIEDRFDVKDEISKVKFTVKTIYTLNEADRMRDQLASDAITETEKSYLKYYTKIYPKIESADTLKIIDDPIKNQLTTLESYYISNFYKRDSIDGDFVSNFYANPINDQLPSLNIDLKNPRAVTYPLDIDYTIKVVQNNGWNVDKEHYELKRQNYQFSSNVTSDESTLSLNYKFSFLNSFIPVDELQQFKNDIKNLTDDHLSYSISHNPSDNNAPFRLNTSMLAAALILAVALGLIGFRIYHTETPGIMFAHGASFQPLGGWLIWLLIGLALTPFMTLKAIAIDNNLFDLKTWNLFTEGYVGIKYRSLLILQLTANIIITCYAIFCGLLMFNKRDILPRYIIGYFISAMLLYFAEYLLASIIQEGSIADSAKEALIAALIHAVIWIPYFRRSERVEATFIVPYPSNNYKYEAKEKMKELENEMN